MLTETTPGLACQSAAELVFGRCKRPLRCGFDLTIGAGHVFPEVNFTLPAIAVEPGTWTQVLAEYEQMATGILERAVALRVPGIVLEFELLPAMTATPEWGAEVTRLLVNHLRRAHDKHGLPCAVRVTPTDIRDQGKPPLLRRGQPWETLKRSFELCIEAGAHLISIESIGGKELHDYGLMYGDIRAIVFALGVLAPRDTAWLWDRISAMCAAGGAIPAGDSACGFANTAMQLAHQRMLPEVLAAVVRAMSAVRSLAAFEHGAVGPSKDCAYEGPIVKAITGCPISMEGKSASCAHFSPLGNIAAAMCDLWSNESVQNVRLLSGSAPEAFTETLAYDCRLMNVASDKGEALRLRDWLTESDEWLSPQAAVLSPEATMSIARAIASQKDHYGKTVAAGLAAVAVLRAGIERKQLTLRAKETQWLDRIERELESLVTAETELTEEMTGQHGNEFDKSSYGL
ncbi:MAG: methyltransferase MtaB domain-containing protein [Bryobacteraceae bacterium]|jgi:methanol--5-hydroxybenzimidazolylcobamide Co-methyltransferase